MKFRCRDCDKDYTRKDSLSRHQKAVHNRHVHQVGEGKRSFLDNTNNSGDERYSPPEKLTRQNAIDNRENADAGRGEFELTRQDSIPDPHFVDSRNYLPMEVYEFKFKHPFCMMVCGPSRSGKTHWVARLLKKRHQMIDTSVDSILYCYAHWQKRTRKLKMMCRESSSNTAFHLSTHSMI